MANECVEEHPATQPYLVEIHNRTLDVRVVVTAYRGKPKIHIGTYKYAKAIFKICHGNTLVPKPLHSSGHVVPIVLLCDLLSEDPSQNGRVNRTVWTFKQILTLLLSPVEYGNFLIQFQCISNRFGYYNIPKYPALLY